MNNHESGGHIQGSLASEVQKRGYLEPSEQTKAEILIWPLSNF